MKKKLYIKPRADRIISYGVNHLLEGTGGKKESWAGQAGEPAKKNIWSSDEDAAEEQYGFRRVGGSTNKLWDD